MGRRLEPRVWCHHAAIADGSVKDSSCAWRSAFGPRSHQPTDDSLRCTHRTDGFACQALCRPRLANAEHPARQVEGFRRVEEWRVLRRQTLKLDPSTRVLLGAQGRLATGN